MFSTDCPLPLISRGGPGWGLKNARSGREVDGIAVGIHPSPLILRGGPGWGSKPRWAKIIILSIIVIFTNP